jgi:hypothetical protein
MGELPLGIPLEVLVDGIEAVTRLAFALGGIWGGTARLLAVGWLGSDVVVRP